MALAHLVEIVIPDREPLRLTITLPALGNKASPQAVEDRARAEIAAAGIILPPTARIEYSGLVTY